jgi:hypothetical protein
MGLASTKGRSSARRAEFRSHLALVAAAVIAAVGVIVFFQTRADDHLVAPTHASAAQLAQPDSEPSDVLGKEGGVLVPEARKVASKFIMSALRRENLDVSWAIATDEMRGGVTRKQWLGGTMPIPPFPVRSLSSTTFRVVASHPDRVSLQVLVLPKVGNDDFEPLRYDMTLVKKDGQWRVSYLVPYAPVGMFSDSSG